MYSFRLLFIVSIYAFALTACSSRSTNNPLPPQVQTHTAPVKSDTISNDELAKTYAQAIADYIKAVNETYKIKFDTLYFGKRQFGQPDDFPDIALPEIIENTHIRLVSPEAGVQKQNAFYINLIGWVNNPETEFIFVAFSDGFKHQFDCTIKYRYDTGLKEYKMNDLQFKNFLYKK